VAGYFMAIIFGERYETCQSVLVNLVDCYGSNGLIMPVMEAIFRLLAFLQD
jgi:hypothetical protein